MKDQKRSAQWAWRIFFFLLGVFLMAMGVSLCISSDLGVSPVSSVPLVFGRIFGMSTGNMTIIVYGVFMLLQLPVLGREFGVKNLLQFPAAVLFGKLIDLTSAWIAPLKPQSYLLKLAALLLGMVFIALAEKVYLPANVVYVPGDGLMAALAHKSRMKTATVKNLFDLSCVAVSAAAGLIFTGKIIGLREGTVIAALGIGRIMALLEPLMGKKVRELCGSRGKA